MSAKREVVTGDLPGGIGPYSQAVRAGDLLYVSGQPGVDPVAAAELNSLFAEFFPEEPPARMVMQVPLPLGLRISIGCVALVET